MGQQSSSQWNIYGRNKDTSKWTESLCESDQREFNKTYHMGHFKHIVYSFACGCLPEYKSIYIYKGRRRMAKASYTTETQLLLEFSDVAVKAAWWTCDERLNGTTSGWMERDFNLKWNVNRTENRMSVVYKQN